MLGSGFLTFFLVGFIILLFVWPFSSDFMIMLVAWVLSLAIATLAKKLMASNCGRHLYKGFFRAKPAIANLVTLALECAYMGLGGGFLILQASQLFLCSVFFIGRFDVPLPSKRALCFGCSIECASTSFISDMLVHEAHRHPYMERLSTMYMVKLKNDSFGREAGACWRQLFVLELMPWLAKYRVKNDKHQTDALKVCSTTSLGHRHQSPSTSSLENAGRQVTHSLVDEEFDDEYAA
jgi:hypothetical protein